MKVEIDDEDLILLLTISSSISSPVSNAATITMRATALWYSIDLTLQNFLSINILDQLIHWTT